MVSSSAGTPLFSRRGRCGSSKAICRSSSCRSVPVKAGEQLTAMEMMAVDPLARVKFLKAAWDAVGSEFASRHTQYEMFYAGARFVTTGHSFRTYDWDAATGMVERFLATYDLAGELAQLHPPSGKAARST